MWYNEQYDRFIFIHKHNIWCTDVAYHPTQFYYHLLSGERAQEEIQELIIQTTPQYCNG